MDTCGTCGGSVGLANTGMFTRWFSYTGATPENWIGRVDERITVVCPACDSYALGAELSSGLPFYSEAMAAFATVNDWDWWNRHPSECDIRRWPDFACLTFSEEAIRSAVGYVRDLAPDVLMDTLAGPPPALLFGPSGIPEDGHEAEEWKNQLEILHLRMRGEYSRHELDVVVRNLIQILV